MFCLHVSVSVMRLALATYLNVPFSFFDSGEHSMRRKTVAHLYLNLLASANPLP